MTNKTTEQILIDAREIVKRGWTKYDFYDGRGNYCAEGALRMAACGELYPEDDAVWFEFRRAEEELWDAVQEKITIWNDSPETTKEVVIAAFDHAIAHINDPRDDE